MNTRNVNVDLTKDTVLGLKQLQVETKGVSLKPVLDSAIMFADYCVRTETPARMSLGWRDESGVITETDFDLSALKPRGLWDRLERRQPASETSPTRSMTVGLSPESLQALKRLKCSSGVNYTTIISIATALWLDFRAEVKNGKTLLILEREEMFSEPRSKGVLMVP